MYETLIYLCNPYWRISLQRTIYILILSRFIILCTLAYLTKVNLEDDLEARVRGFVVFYSH